MEREAGMSEQETSVIQEQREAFNQKMADKEALIAKQHEIIAQMKAQNEASLAQMKAQHEATVAKLKAKREKYQHNIAAYRIKIISLEEQIQSFQVNYSPSKLVISDLNPANSE